MPQEPSIPTSSKAILRASGYNTEESHPAYHRHRFLGQGDATSRKVTASLSTHQRCGEGLRINVEVRGSAPLPCWLSPTPPLLVLVKAGQRSRVVYPPQAPRRPQQHRCTYPEAHTWLVRPRLLAHPLDSGGMVLWKKEGKFTDG
jgi:hypothetical protein